MQRIFAASKTTWAFLRRDARATLRDFSRAWAVIFPLLSALWRFLTSRALLTILGLLLLVAAFPAVGFLLWPFLQYTMQPTSFAERKEVIVLLAQGLALTGGAGALIFTWLRLRAAERTIQISMEGQITERFTRAIAQLGDPKLEVRLGGIYALERIARDSPRDHWTIMDVLTAYVRNNAPWKEEARPAQPSPGAAAAAQAGAESSPAAAIKPRTDIQAILTVIGRRPEKARKEERKNDHGLDLSGTNLRGADLTNAHLERVNLRDAHVGGANFRDAHLERASLLKAHLTMTLLHFAHLDGANLWYAHLEGAFLSDAHLKGADLLYARLEGAILVNAHLEGAFLSNARLDGAFLSNAHLEGATLRGVTGLTRRQLASAFTDVHTILPGYLKDQGSAPPSSP